MINGWNWLHLLCLIILFADYWLPLVRIIIFWALGVEKVIKKESTQKSDHLPS